MRIKRKLDVELQNVHVEPYHKGGFVMNFTTGVTDSWSDAVIELLAQVQQIGGNLHLSGSVLDEIDIWAGTSSIPGIKAIHLYCPREQKE